MEKEHVVLHLCSYLKLREEVATLTKKVEDLQRQANLVGESNNHLLTLIKGSLKNDYYVKEIKSTLKVKEASSSSVQYYYDEALKYCGLGHHNFPQFKEFELIIRGLLDEIVAEFIIEIEKERVLKEKDDESISIA